MDKRQFLYAFHFYYQSFFNQDIQPKCAWKTQAMIPERNVLLSRELDAALRELPTKTFFINMFDHAWPQVAVNIECRANDTLRKIPINSPVHLSKLYPGFLMATSFGLTQCSSHNKTPYWSGVSALSPTFQNPNRSRNRLSNSSPHYDGNVVRTSPIERILK